MKKTTMTRDFSEVVDGIKALIPPDPQWNGLRAELQKIVDHALYTAPELRRNDWARMCNVLEQHLGTPDTAWKKWIADLVGGRVSPAEATNAARAVAKDRKK